MGSHSYFSRGAQAWGLFAIAVAVLSVVAVDWLAAGRDFAPDTTITGAIPEKPKASRVHTIRSVLADDPLVIRE